MKKSTKHMQFLRISLLIFALSFIFACSLGTQSYGTLSLSIEVPDYLKTEPNEQPSNARFIHPNGDRLEFKLYTERRVIHTQTITLNPQHNNTKPQTVSISVDKVPYNVPLSAKITVFGETTTTLEDEVLGSNDIYIGYLKSGNNKLTLVVKPENGANVVYQGQQRINLVRSPDTYPDTSADTFNIEMFPQKGLYTFCVYGSDVSPYDSAYIYLYDSDGKKYQNSFLINGPENAHDHVFYHPEDKASTYYAYLSEETYYLSGYKLDQDILITRPDDDMDGDVIVGSEEYIDIYSEKGRSFTIYNPYPFTLNLANTIKNAEEADVEPDSTEKFTFDFPDAILPGTSKEFTVNFQNNTGNEFYRVKSTISANGGLKDFVLYFTGYTSD